MAKAALFAALTGLLMTVALAATSVADELAEPTGPVILTIGGALDRTNFNAKAVFDRKMLEELGTTTMTTSTSWTDGPQEFEGALARDVLRAVGANGRSIAATALDDYSTTIPLSDFDKYRVLFATKMNGVELKPGDKGPIWIVYPRDDHEELRNDEADAKWIWQLSKIRVQ